MPELPEVETIRLQLDQKLKGLRITEVEVLNKKSFIGEIGKIRGRRVRGVRRRGKITIIELEGGIFLAIHLKLTGQLIFKEVQSSKFKVQNYSSKLKVGEERSLFSVGELPNKFTRVIISFDNGGKLFFNDLRMFGWVKIIQSSKLNPSTSLRARVKSDNSKFKIEDEIPELSKLGPEAIDEKSFTLEYFKNILAKSKKPIKLIIMDQEKLAGVGNIYANEALFAAGIMPTRPANTLKDEDIKMLRYSILEILKEAIKHKGTSDRDEAYRQISGEKGEYQNFLQVYGQEGKKCPKCSGTIKRIGLGGRGTFFCPRCQK